MQNAVANLRKSVHEIGSRRLLFLGALTVGHIVVHWYTQMLSLVLPSLKADLHLTNVQVGTITTAQMGVNSATNLPSGYLADSFPRQRPLILAAAILTFGVAFFLMGTAASYPWVLLAAGMVGLGTALWHPGALGSLSLRFPDRRGMALSVHGVGASIGDALSPVIVGAIIVAVAWRPTLRAHLLPAVVFAVVLWRTLGTMDRGGSPKPSFRSYTRGVRGMLANRQVLAVMASGTLMGIARLSILTFFPIYIKETMGYSSFILGVYLTLLYVMGMVSQPVMGIVSDRLGRKAVLVPSYAAMGLLYIAIILVHGSIQLGLVVGTLGLFFYAILNIMSSAVMDVAAKDVQSSTMGVTGLVSQPFTLASPIVAGYLVTRFGITATFWYAGIAMFLASAILVPVRFARVVEAPTGR